MIELYNDDCLKILGKIPDNSIDLILTDPPYNISKVNNFNTMGRRGIDFGDWDKNFNDLSWIKQAFRILKKGGSLVIFNGWQNIGEMSKYAENIGFNTKDLIRWIKNNPMPRNRDRRYVVDYELACWLVKPLGKWTFNRINDNYDRPEYNYSVVAGKEKTKHPTQKPVALMKEILTRHSNENDIVLDCFMGSGTTGVACKELNRNFIGIELNKEYFDIAKARLNEYGLITNEVIDSKGVVKHDTLW